MYLFVVWLKTVINSRCTALYGTSRIVHVFDGAPTWGDQGILNLAARSLQLPGGSDINHGEI